MRVLHFGHIQSLFKVVERLLRLQSLLTQRIIQYNFVPLNQSLTVLLPMLQLFIPVSLDSLQEGRESKLLGVP